MSKRLLFSMISLLLAIGASCYALTHSLMRLPPSSGWIALPIGSSPAPVAPAKLKGAIFSLKVADTDETRRQGLAGVAEIPVDGGMVFVYPDADERGFWMYGCVTDMDIAFLDSSGQVVSLYTMLKEPLRQAGESEQQYKDRLHVYDSRGLVKYAVEVRPGTWSRLGLCVGDCLQIRQAPAK
jgi:uncharacterized membrane protein (UPF0127 family)